MSRVPPTAPTMLPMASMGMSRPPGTPEAKLRMEKMILTNRRSATEPSRSGPLGVSPPRSAVE